MSTRAFLICLANVLVLLALPVTTRAHGGGTPRLTNAPAGPYRLYAWSDPEPWRAGEVHLSLAVTLPDPNAGGQPGAQVEVPVTDAEIAVILAPETGAPIRLTATRQPFLNDFYFEADTILPSDGTWEVTIVVDGPAGQGSNGFQIEALPPRTLNLPLLGAGIGMLVLVAALAGVWSRRQDTTPSPSRRPRRTKPDPRRT